MIAKGKGGYLVAVGVGAVLATGGAAVAASGGGQPRAHEPVPGHTELSAPDGAVARAAASPRPDYREFAKGVDPYKETGVTLVCPRAAPRAMGGYFGTASKAGRGRVIMTNSNPVGRDGRRWDVGVVSTAPKRVKVFFGVVCAR